ncbi:uncharacterized protein [Apostichopus japonicus]|uniref:uncharacterized protein n=1 Tax=Stichopus japonicus TaxID=307972 RepID=UPI003AB3C374
MSEFIQKPSEPANNNVAWGFPGCDTLSDDSLRIKFGDFEVQPMDNDKVIVYLDDLVFVDGVLVEGSSGLPSVPSNNNNHSIPLPSTTTTLEDQPTDQEQQLQESQQSSPTEELRATVALCNQTIAELVHKKLLKFEKAQRGIFKKRSVSHHRERDDVIRVLNRLSEESRQVVKIHHDMAFQLKIKQRDQTILKKAVTSFGKEVKANSAARRVMKDDLGSMTVQCRELENQLKETDSRWNDRLAAKEQECQRHKKKEMNMTHLLRENSQTLDIVTSELNNANTKMTSLLEDNQQLKIEMTSLQITADKTEYDLQTSLRFKDKLQAEKSFLESGVKNLEEKLRSQRQFFCEQEETLRKQWGEMLLIKERDCERYKKEMENMAITLNKSKSVVFKVTDELSNAKKELTSLRNNNRSLKKTMKVLEKNLEKVKQDFTTVNAEHEANMQYLESDVKTMEEKFVSERKIHSEEAKVIREIHEEEMTCMKRRMDSQIVAKDELIQSLQSGMKALEYTLKEQILFHQDELKDLEREYEMKIGDGMIITEKVIGEKNELQNKLEELNQSYADFMEHSREMEMIHEMKITQYMGEIKQLEENLDKEKSQLQHQMDSMAEYYSKMVEEKEHKLKCYEQKMQESLSQIEVLKKAVSRENEFKLKADELQRQLNEMKNLTEEHELLQVRLFLETCCSNAVIEELTATFQQEKVRYESKYKKELSQTRCNYDVLVRNSQTLREENEEAKKKLIDLLQKCNSTGLQQDQEEMQSERAEEHRGSFMKHREEMHDIDKGSHSQLSFLICELDQYMIHKNQFTHPVGRVLVQQNKENIDELIALGEQIKRLEKTNIDLQKDSEYKADHLRQNNKQLQKRFLNLQDKHAHLRQQYDKMKHRMHVKTDGLLTSKRDKGLLSDNDVASDRDVRVTQLKGELNEKTKEQEEMRSLIRWLKKDLYKTNNDLIQLKKENGELVSSKDKLESELQQWIHQASSMRKNDVHAMHRAMQLKEAERVKTHAKMNFIQMKKKNMWNEQEMERLQAIVAEREEEFKRISRDLADRESDVTTLLSELDKAEMKVKEKTKEMKRMQKQMDEIEKDNRDLQEEIMAYENT